jgi:hypothetical protein
MEGLVADGLIGMGFSSMSGNESTFMDNLFNQG